MATTNAFASRPRENQSRDTRLIDNNKPRITYSGNSKGEYKQGVTGSKTGSNGTNSNYNKAAKPVGTFNKDYNNKDFKNKDFKNNDYANKNYKNKDYKNKDYKNNIYDKDKDYDLDIKHGKGKPNESKSKSSQSKDKEQQPDKLETMKRLEKEKKVMLKKNQELNDKEKPNKPIAKQRRTTNIDWTKGYEKGLFGDDDEDYTEYY